MYTGLHVNYPLFLSDFNLTLILAADFRKSPQISNFLVTEDMAKLVVEFRRRFPDASRGKRTEN